MNINVFSWLLSFSKLRESGKQKFGCKGRMSQSYLSYFLTGFHWRISLLSRASRLCIAFNAGLRDSGLSCLSLLSLARSEMAIVRLPRDLSKNCRGEGNPTSVWGPPTNHLASFSLSPSDVRRPKVT